MFNSPFSMVVAIVLIGCIYSLVDNYLKRRGHDRDAPAPGPDAETLEIIERLEHRVTVLERIVTDSGYNLKREIDEM